MFEPTSTVGRLFVPGSQIVKGATVGARGVLGGISSGLSEGSLAFRGLFHPQGVGGGTCCCIGGHPLGKNLSTVMVRRTTILSFGSLISDSSDELTDSTST